jgi:hypothetical protein
VSTGSFGTIFFIGWLRYRTYKLCKGVRDPQYRSISYSYGIVPYLLLSCATHVLTGSIPSETKTFQSKMAPPCLLEENRGSPVRREITRTSRQLEENLGNPVPSCQLPSCPRPVKPAAAAVKHESEAMTFYPTMEEFKDLRR